MDFIFSNIAHITILITPKLHILPVLHLFHLILD